MPSVAAADLGTKVTSAPEPISIETSATPSPRSGWRRMTVATGAGGAKRRSSYAGISGFLGNLLREVARLLRPRQARAPYAGRRPFLDAGDHDIDPRMLGESHGL